MIKTPARRLAGLLVLCSAAFGTIPSTADAGAGAIGNRTPSRSARDSSPGPRRERSTPFSAPVLFESNRGQAGADVEFVARGVGIQATFHGDGVRFLHPDLVSGAGITLEPLAPSADRKWLAGPNHPGMANHFIGNDKSRWVTGIPLHKDLLWRGLWPGVDVRWLDDGGRLRYDILATPGANLDDIAFRCAGVEALELDDEGCLVARLGDVRLRQSHPLAWQSRGSERWDVPVAFRLVPGGFGFKVGPHDPGLPILIDPTVEFSTQLGSGNVTFATPCAMDSLGHLVVAGETNILTFPTTQGVYQEARAGSEDIFVAKFDRDDHSLLFATYIGGLDQDRCYAMAIDAEDNIHLTGYTNDSQGTFPTLNADQSVSGGIWDAFVIKLSSQADKLLYSTFLGGSGYEQGFGVAADAAGNTWVTGYTRSSDFPLSYFLDASFAGGSEAFLARYSGKSGSLQMSTFLGGDGADGGQGLAITTDGHVWIAGYTGSTDFPTVSPIQDSLAGRTDAFLAAYDPSTETMDFSTYHGGSHDDEGRGVAVSPGGKVVLAGHTLSSDLPLKNAIEDTLSGGQSGFVLMLDAEDYQVDWSTYLGGGGNDRLYAVTIDQGDYVTVAGGTKSSDFPLAASTQGTYGGMEDMYVSRFLPDGSDLAFSTYHGGSKEEQAYGVATDGAALLVVGRTQPTDFPKVDARPEGNSGQRLAGIVLFEFAPAPMRKLTAVQPSEQEVELRWVDSHDAGYSVEVERRADGGTFEVVASVEPGVEQWTDTSPPEGAVADYRVRGLSDGGETAYSNWATVKVPVLAPIGLSSVIDGNHSIELSWEGRSSVGNEILVLRRALTAPSTLMEIATLDPDDSGYTDIAVLPDTTYSYVIRVVTAGGETGDSEPLVASTAPANPTGLIVHSFNDAEIRVLWTDTSSTETAFEVQRRVAEGQWTTAGQSVPNVAAFTVTGLSPETEYGFRVRATNASGASDWTSELTGSTAPPIPQGVTSETVSSTEVLVRWSAQGTSLTGFALESRVGDSGPWESVADIDAAKREYLHSGATRGTAVSYRLRARGNGGASRPSAVTTSRTNAQLVINRAGTGPGKGKKSAFMVMDGLIEFGTMPADLDSPASVEIAGTGFSFPAFSSVKNGKFHISSLEHATLTMVPPRKGGSRFGISLEITGEDVPPLPGDGRLVVVYRSGSFVASGSAFLSDGAFDVRKGTGEWESPGLQLTTLKASIKKPGAHKLSLVATCSRNALDANEPGDVVLRLGELEVVFPAAEFVVKNGRWTLKRKNGEKWSVTVDPGRGIVSVKGSRLALGAFATGEIPVHIEFLVSGLGYRDIPVLLSSGSKLSY